MRPLHHRSRTSTAALAALACALLTAGCGGAAQASTTGTTTTSTTSTSTSRATSGGTGSTAAAASTTAATTTATATSAAKAAATAAATALAARTTTTTVTLPATFKSRTPGYNNVATWTRADTASAGDGTVWTAWQASDGVHVTHLSGKGKRIGTDVVVAKAKEVSGLVGHADGFALLTRKPGTNKYGDTQAHLVRYTNGKLTWDRQLTSNSSSDSAPVLDGALEWNGTKYAAYFVIHGVAGDTDGHYGDKMVYVGKGGKVLSGGWAWGCSHNEGIALGPKTSGAFVSLCFEDWRSGLFVSTGIGAPNEAPVVSREECWAGYCGGEFGGLVQEKDGTWAVAFTSRGHTSVKSDGTGRGYIVEAKYRSHQIAFARLGSSGKKVVQKTTLLTTDKNTDVVQVHLNPYGSNQLLLSYETVTVSKCDTGTCLGTYSGSYLQVLSATGKRVGKAVKVSGHLVGEAAELPDGDLMWAYAPVTPSYSKAISAATGGVKKLKVVRLDVP